MMQAGVLGAGEIGQALAARIAAHPSLELSWVVDIDPAVIGAAVEGTDLVVSGAPTTEVGVLFQTTTSSMRRAAEQLQNHLGPGLLVVSSCEEMAFPIGANTDVAATLDGAAVRAGSHVTGTGVNPGFVMEVLALAATGAQLWVDAVRVHRVVDLRSRRRALQQKMGLGRPVEEVQSAIDERRLGHVGLAESLHLLAHGLGGRILDQAHRLEPIEHDGMCLGLRERCAATLDTGERLELVLEMHGEPEAAFDAITIEGDPPIVLRIDGGVAGEAGTLGRMINAVPGLLAAGPGFHTALDLGLPRRWAGALK